MLDTLWSQTTVSSAGASVNLSLENPLVPIGDPEAYETLTDGEESSSGSRVTRDRALRIPAVWQAIQLISGDVAKIPLDLYQRLPHDGRERQDSHPVHNLVKYKPNRELDAFKFWRRVMFHLLYWQNAYVYVSKVGGKIVELIPLLPDRTTPERSADGQLYYVTEVDGRLQPLLPEYVWHIEGICCDNLEALNMMQFARDAFGIALERMNCAAKFFKNGMRTGGILEVPSSMTKGNADKLEQGWRKTYEGGEEAFKTIVLREGAKFHMAQLSPEQTQMTESSRESVRDVARYFNVRPSKLGEEAKSSYSSKAEDNRDYLDSTLSHHLVAIVAQSNDKLLTPQEKAAGYYFEHNTAALLQMDFKSVCEAITSLRSSEVLSPNECRALLNYNRRDDPGGDDYGNPNTKSNSNSRTSNEFSAADDAVAVAHQHLLSVAMSRMASMVGGKASRSAATPDDLRTWVTAKLPGLQKTIQTAVEPVVRAHAAAARVDAESTTTKAVGLFMKNMKAMLLNLATAPPAGLLKAAVTEAVENVCCDMIAEEIIPTGGSENE